MIAETGAPVKPKIAQPGNKPSRKRETGYHVRGRIWVEKDGELYLGWGRVLLLERLDEMKSIAAAARSMGLTYRNAWLWIESMNSLAPSPLVEKAVGGGGGGHARLTEAGREAVALYKKLHGSIGSLLEQEARSIHRESGIPSLKRAKRS
jgi:molybdate transport system regulatory protein